MNQNTNHPSEVRPVKNPHHPLGCFDANEWAKEWCEIALKIKSEGREVIDHHWMLGWFANAIMTGFDEAKRQAVTKESKGEEVTAEMALEWLAKSDYHLSYWEGKYLIQSLEDSAYDYSDYRTEYEGKTPLAAIRSAMAKEKEGGK